MAKKGINDNIIQTTDDVSFLWRPRKVNRLKHVFQGFPRLYFTGCVFKYIIALCDWFNMENVSETTGEFELELILDLFRLKFLPVIYIFVLRTSLKTHYISATYKIKYLEWIALHCSCQIQTFFNFANRGNEEIISFFS